MSDNFFDTSIFQLPHFKTEILSFDAEGPDEYGDYTITIKFTVKNNTSKPWHLVEFYASLMNDKGQLIGDGQAKEERSINSQEEEEFEISMWSVAKPLCSGDLSKYSANIKVLASKFEETDIGTYGISDTPFEITPINGSKLSDEVSVIGGALWRSLPDESNDINVHTTLSVQNLSFNRITHLQFVVNVSNESEELFDAGGTDEVKPYDIQILSNYGYGSEDDLAGGVKADCKIYYSSLCAESSASTLNLKLINQSSDDEAEESNKKQSSSERDTQAISNPVDSNESKVHTKLNLMEAKMASKLTFKLVVEEDGNEVFSKPLSYEAVSNIVSNYEDEEGSNEFFTLAAKHPASSVRENVAYKDKISPEIMSILIKDSSIAVLRNIVRTESFKENAGPEDIERLIKLDVEIAQAIAGDIDSYQQADASKLCSLILALDDPSILAALAGNYNAPKKILKELVNHPDPHVANEAKRRLED